MNKFIMIGRLVTEPEVKRTQEGKPVIRFRYAVNKAYRREGEAEADFFSCVAYGKTAERFEKLNILKGTKLMLEGEVRNNNYTDTAGVKRYENQLVVENFEFVESKNASQPAEAFQPAEASQKADKNDFVPLPDDLEDEGLPF